MVYGTDKQLAYALHEEGMVLNTGVYQYHLKDYLGNTRAMFSKNAGTNQPVELAQATDYYPFGKSFENNDVPKNRYLYNGKEFQDQVIGGIQFGWYDYGARFYDPEIGRWHFVDPLAEKYYSTTPYAYCANDPVNSYDGDGRKIIYVNGYFSRLLNLMGAAPGAAKEGYWNFFSKSFISNSRQFMGATDRELNEFIDGSSYFGGDQSGGDRFELGFLYAINNYEELCKGMKEGETFKFVSHSEGGAFAAGMASYLRNQKGHKVESMLYLSPDEADEFSHPIGIFSMQSHFQNDPVSPSMKLDGVDIYMNFSSLYDKPVGKTGAHGGTVTSENLKKMTKVLGQLGPFASKLMIKGQWSITETKNGYIFKRIDEQKKE